MVIINGDQNRQYILFPELITVYEKNTKFLDIVFNYGFSNTTDTVGLCFMNNNKMKIFFAVTSGYSVAVTNIIGYK